MLRVFIALNLLLLNIYACKDGYNSCISKLKHSKTFQNKTLQIPISGNKKLIFSQTKPKAVILKHDPFLCLYIIEDKKGFKHPFKINMQYPSGLASVTDKKAIELKIKKRQIGLNQFAISNYPLQELAVLTNSCCSLEGIVTPQGIIEKVYIKRFINKKDIRYGDIGIRIKDTYKGILVSSYNPFIKQNPFKKGDYILSFDGKKVKYSATLMRRILFAKIGFIYNVTVRRENKILNIKVKSQERLSGGYKAETYLESYGLSFDKNLKIIAIDRSKKNYGLAIGDKLIQVNKYLVTKQEQVRRNIPNFKYYPKLLFERNDNFQFFVNLN